MVLRDGTGFLQCVLNDKLVLIINLRNIRFFINDFYFIQCHTYDAILLSSEATVCIFGKVSAVPEGKQAPRNVELSADYWEVVGHSPAGGAESVLNEA